MSCTGQPNHKREKKKKKLGSQNEHPHPILPPGEIVKAATEARPDRAPSEPNAALPSRNPQPHSGPQRPPDAARRPVGPLTHVAEPARRAHAYGTASASASHADTRQLSSSPDAHVSSSRGGPGGLGSPTPTPPGGVRGGYKSRGPPPPNLPLAPSLGNAANLSSHRKQIDSTKPGRGRPDPGSPESPPPPSSSLRRDLQSGGVGHVQRAHLPPRLLPHRLPPRHLQLRPLALLFLPLTTTSPPRPASFSSQPPTPPKVSSF